MNDPDVLATLGGSGRPITRNKERELLDELSTCKTDVIWAIETLEGKHLGISGIHGISYPNGTAESGSYIADTSDRGQGYGTEASILRAKYAFDVLGLRMLKSIYIASNKASERMLAKTGYVEYGRLMEGYWKNGKYEDDVFVVLTKQRFFELHSELFR